MSLLYTLRSHVESRFDALSRTAYRSSFGTEGSTYYVIDFFRLRITQNVNAYSRVRKVTTIPTDMVVNFQLKEIETIVDAKHQIQSSVVLDARVPLAGRVSVAIVE